MKEQQKVERIINELDAIPAIEARGGRIQQTDQQIEINVLKKATNIRVKGSGAPTNLVDYLTDDKQITAMLVEGLRLGVIHEANLNEREISYTQLTLGNRVGLRLPPLNHLQKAEALSLILLKSGCRASTATLFLDRLGGIVFDPVTHVEKCVFDNLDLLNCLTAGAKTALSRYMMDTSTAEIERLRTVRGFADIGGIEADKMKAIKS